MNALSLFHDQLLLTVKVSLNIDLEFSQGKNANPSGEVIHDLCHLCFHALQAHLPFSSKKKKKKNPEKRWASTTRTNSSMLRPIGSSFTTWNERYLFWIDTKEAPLATRGHSKKSHTASDSMPYLSNKA